jgi:hypothetical protein
MGKFWLAGLNTEYKENSMLFLPFTPFGCSSAN